MYVYDERERHWRMGIDDHEGGKYDEKYFIYYNKWYVYMRDKLSLIKDGNYVDVSGYERKKVI